MSSPCRSWPWREATRHRCSRRCRWISSLSCPWDAPGGRSSRGAMGWWWLVVRWRSSRMTLWNVMKWVLFDIYHYQHGELIFIHWRINLHIIAVNLSICAMVCVTTRLHHLRCSPVRSSGSSSPSEPTRRSIDSAPRHGCLLMGWSSIAGRHKKCGKPAVTSLVLV